MRLTFDAGLARKVLLFSKWIFAGTVIFCLSELNDPLMHKFGSATALFLTILLTASILKFCKKIKNNNAKLLYQYEQVFFIIVLLIGIIILLHGFLKYQYKKYVVLTTPQSILESFGRHFIIGYTKPEEVKVLIAKGAIGGIYITSRNIHTKSVADIKQEISSFQSLSEKYGFAPLFIAADQEGGNVSRLSEIFQPLPPLSSVVNDTNQDRQVIKSTENYAAVQAGQLASLGVNLNLSPVVDLKTSCPEHALNACTRIEQRAISADMESVMKVARVYCTVLLKHGVRPTLKHFPGLGRVKEDTHLTTGVLEETREFLERNDWRPFKEIGVQLSPFIMLGHVIVPSIDPVFPASISEAIISDIIRKDWRYNGILITDDLNMGAIAKRREAIGTSAVRALNAGADLILLSYDGSQYYNAMYALIQAYHKGTLNLAILNQSRQRLAAHQPDRLIPLRENRF